jgi:hypothetical protein
MEPLRSNKRAIEQEAEGMEHRVVYWSGSLGADEHLMLWKQVRALPPALLKAEVAEFVAF